MAKTRITEFERVLMDRDGMTRKAAERERIELQQRIGEMMADGCSYDEVEDLLLDEYGLEMDYIIDLI